jgi:hypothetical protein
MKSILTTITLTLLLLGCTQNKSSETQTSSSGTPMDSLQTIEQPVDTKQLNLEIESASKFSLDETNLMKFQFASNSNFSGYGVYVLTLSDSGKFTITHLTDGIETSGTWQLSNKSIQLAIGTDTASFIVKSFTEDQLTLATDELGGKLFSAIDNTHDSYYYIPLYPLIFSAPYLEDQFSGEWQGAGGGIGFEPNGIFGFGAADCDVNGTWEFDGEYISIDLTDVKNCGWANPFDTRLQLIKLSQKLMVIKNSKGGIETFSR